jgi:hypothetical protein
VLPGDVSGMEMPSNSIPHSVITQRTSVRPSEAEIARLADVLNSGRRVALFCGFGCADAHDEVIALADKLKAPVGVAYRGKPYVAYDNPFEVGMIGLMGYGAAYDAVHECDVLLLLGTSFPYDLFLPTKPTIAQVDIRVDQLGRRGKLDLGLWGDVRETIQALFPMLDTKTDRAFLDKMLNKHRGAMERLNVYVEHVGKRRPMHPEHVAATLDELASNDAIITADTGMCNVWSSHYIRPTKDRRLIGSFNHGSMANALPQAIGAQCAFPGRQVISMSGDGGLAMLMGEDGRLVDPDDLVFLDDNQPIAVQIVRLSFELAKADSALATTAAFLRNEPATSTHTNASSSDLARFISLKNQTDTASQKATQDINALKKKIAGARGADRRKLQAALDEAISRLELLQAGSQTINSLVEFVQSAGAGNAQNEYLTSVINDLEQTLPGVANPATPLAKLRIEEAGSRATGSAHDSGIPGLASKLAALKNKLRSIDENMRLTDDLAQSVQNLRKPIAASSNRVRRGALTTLQTSDLSLLQQHKAQLDALAVELKSLSPAIVALDKQKVLIAAYKSHLGNWRGAVVDEYRQARNRLISRLLIVGLILVLVAGISEVSRRLLVRHIQDTNRRRLITMVHLLLTLCAIAMVAVFVFVSSLSSLVTYLGILTAGVAIALQNVTVPSLAAIWQPSRIHWCFYLQQLVC